MSDTEHAVIVVGSLHYDIMLDAPHLPARGETVTGSRWYPKFGGKGGNQAIAAHAFGVKTRLVGAVGRDGFGKFLLDSLNAAGIATEHIEVKPESPSGMSVAISEAGGDYGAVIVSGVNLEIGDANLLNPELWCDASVMLLQNEISNELNLKAAKMARQRDLTVCLNAAPVRDLNNDLADLIDILIVNSLEAEALTGVLVVDLASAGLAATKLRSRISCAIVTAGEAGVAVSLMNDDDPVLIAAKQVPVMSTHGAGDVFAGTFAAALAKGKEIGKAAQVANQVAARHVSGQTD